MADVIDQAAVFINMELSNQIRAARKKIQPRENAVPECEGCGEPIPEARRQAMPGCRYCVSCQTIIDKGGLP